MYVLKYLHFFFSVILYVKNDFFGLFFTVSTHTSRRDSLQCHTTHRGDTLYHDRPSKKKKIQSLPSILDKSHIEKCTYVSTNVRAVRAKSHFFIHVQIYAQKLSYAAAVSHKISSTDKFIK